MAAGFRSPLPLLGLGAGAAPTTTAGVRSMLAPWIGGAGSAGVAPTTDAGVRSLLAFWIGGAGTVGITPAVTGGGGGGPIDEPYYWVGTDRRQDKEQAPRDDRAALRADLLRAVDALEAPQGVQTSARSIDDAQHSDGLEKALQAAAALQMPAAAADAQGANSLLFAAMLALLEDDD